MIAVKGTKEAAVQQRDGSQYRFAGEEQRTGIPVTIAAVIVSIVAFLQSLVPWWRDPESGEPEREVAEPPAAPEDTAVTANTLSAVIPFPAYEPVAVAPLPARVETGEPVARPPTDNVVIFPRRHYELVDSPAVSFAGSLPVLSPPAPAPVLDAQPTPEYPRWVGEDPSPEEPGKPGPAEPVEPAEPLPRRNRAPESSGALRLNDGFAGAIVLISTAQLLVGATDADGDELTIRNVRVSDGSIGGVDGGFVFSSHRLADLGPVTLTYEVSDGQAVVTRKAVLNLVDRVPIEGTPGPDTISGSALGDHIDAGAGDDLIATLAGADVIVGGDGNDIIAAGDGGDFVLAGAGDDIVMAGAGDDIVDGGAGDDRLHGEAGDDVLAGGGGADTLLGGTGDDLLEGGAGADRLDGEEGSDLLLGGAGADRLDGGDGEDRVFGEAGDDIAVAALDAADDFIDGGADFDTIDYSAASEGIALDLAAGSAESDEIGRDTIVGFEAVRGGGGDDVFTIGNDPFFLTGGDGDDTFRFDVPEGTSEATLIHHILDFMLGDRINVAAFEFSFERRDDGEDRFSRYYRDRDEPDTAGLELRIRHRDDDGDAGGRELTDFSFDYDGNLEFEMTITLHGRYQPFVYETPAA